ncbi:hypothetical protein GOV07_00140 [Candidatus Woesearchaeota archaeon]|nr:hypothetical protein [Candidatus Woesearchaeota archaeon]
MGTNEPKYSVGTINIHEDRRRTNSFLYATVDVTITQSSGYNWHTGKERTHGDTKTVEVILSSPGINKAYRKMRRQLRFEGVPERSLPNDTRDVYSHV